MPEAEVYCRPCPLFVPLAEEGWLQGPVPREVSHVYLDDLVDTSEDRLDSAEDRGEEDSVGDDLPQSQCRVASAQPISGSGWKAGKRFRTQAS